MKYLKFSSLSDFISNQDISQYNKNTLLISDIDGVFFRGIFDPREIIGIISKKNITVLEKILLKKIACWIFTNRPAIFKYFSFIRQISDSIKKVTGVTPNIYSKCSHFLEDRSQNYAIIMNAKKPSEQSQEVIEKGIKNFEKVIYISARDLPFYYSDKQLIQKLNKRLNLDKLVFIEISK